MTSEILFYSDFLENREFIQWRLERTTQQDDYWSSFIKENPSLVEEFEKAISIFEKLRINEHDFTDTDLLYQKIQLSISNHRKKKYRIVNYLSVAAVALLLIVGTFLINKESMPTTATNEQIIGETHPSEDVLLLVGGDVITLNQNSEVEQVDGQMTYTDSTDTKKIIKTDDVQMNKLIVPNGKRSSLILADGSKVWINSGTELEFPSKFNNDTRDIYVNGEIYIDVHQSTKQPFIVHTATFDVEVFGTSFNVSAYDDDDETSVVLVEGSVKLNSQGNSVKMRPNEMARFRAGSFSKQEIDVSLYTSWIKGVFIFDGTPIAEVLKKVGRYYNISFSEIQSIPDNKITGKLYLSENIDDVLSSISILTSSEYKREDNIIKLINNK